LAEIGMVFMQVYAREGKSEPKKHHFDAILPQMPITPYQTTHEIVEQRLKNKLLPSLRALN